jgi:hypothetical protein
MFAGRVRQHRFNGGLADRAAHALGKNEGTGGLPASGKRAIAGTASKLIAYPTKVTGQYLPVLSAMYPETDRRL